MYKHYEDQGVDTEVIVVQQNCDPWNEQFDSNFYDQVIQNNINLSLPLVTPNTRFIVSSESAIQEGIWLDRTQDARALKTLHDYVKRFPKLAFVIGGTTYEWVPKGMEDDFPARQVGETDKYYYCHNSALLIDSVGMQHRNKSQLTPAVEAIPEWMGFLRNFSLTMGIARGTLKGDPEAKVMTFGDHKIGAAICYESAFGEYVSSFTQKGADLLFVITTDGGTSVADNHVAFHSPSPLSSYTMALFGHPVTQAGAPHAFSRQSSHFCMVPFSPGARAP